MDRTSSAILAAAALIFAACNGPATSPDPVERVWTTNLIGDSGWEHLTGSSTVTWTEGGAAFQASARIEGDAEGEIRPWHVHHGTCGTGGGIVGEDGHYPRLEGGADGSAEAAAEVPMPLTTAASYHVNVHLSVPEMAVIIACGDLHIAVENPDGDPPVYD